MKLYRGFCLVTLMLSNYAVGMQQQKLNHKPALNRIEAKNRQLHQQWIEKFKNEGIIKGECLILDSLPAQDLLCLLVNNVDSDGELDGAWPVALKKCPENRVPDASFSWWQDDSTGRIRIRYGPLKTYEGPSFISHAVVALVAAAITGLGVWWALAPEQHEANQLSTTSNKKTSIRK